MPSEVLKSVGERSNYGTSSGWYVRYTTDETGYVTHNAQDGAHSQM